MTNQKAWMFFNTETPLPKNHEYYTEEEIVEAMQKYADQQLILSGVSQQRELLIEAFDLINIHDGDREKITKLVDITLKSINCG
jgi:hypothetical protein